MGVSSSRVGVPGACGTKKLNIGPLEELYVLLNTELSLLSLFHFETLSHVVKIALSSLCVQV